MKIEVKRYENGMSITPYKNGKKHGVARWYDENGNLSTEISFKKDKRHGVAKTNEQRCKITNEEKEFIEFMRDDSRINFIVYGTLIRKIFIENTDKKFLDTGSGLIPLKSDFSKQSDDKLVWILAYIKVLLVAQMQEEDEDEEEF